MFKQLAKFAAAGAGVGGGYFAVSRYSEEQDRKTKNEELAIRNSISNPNNFHLNSYNHLNELKKWDWDWDHRQPTEDKEDNDKINADCDFVDIKRPGKAAYRNIFLVRHGQYDTKAEGDENRKLTELGHEQAKQTGIRLANWFSLEKQKAIKKWSNENKENMDGFNFPKIKVVQSSMTRARETCTEIRQVFDHAEVDYDFSGQSDLLREGPPYPTEPPLSKWTHKHAYWEESARIESGFRTFIHRAEPTQEHESNEVIVCHANVIRYFLCRVLQIPPEAWLRFSLRHGSITWIRISPNGTVSVRSVGDAGYMPVDKCSRR